jgi:ketopantoate hydroxymethyltransferase
MMNLQTLKAQHPKLVDQIKTEELVKIERERILQLGELINPNVAKTVRILAEAGLTPEQAKTLLGSVSTVSEQDKKAEILDALKQAHSEGVAGNVPEPARENLLMTTIQRRNKENGEGMKERERGA